MVQIGYSSNTVNRDYSVINQMRYICGNAEYDGTLSEFFIKTGYDDATRTWGAGESGSAGIFISSSRVLVAQTHVTGGTDTAYEWLSASFGPSSITADEDYIIVIWGDSNQKEVSVEDAGTVNSYWNITNTNFLNSGQGNFSEGFDPLPTGDVGTANRELQFFATYDLLPWTNPYYFGHSGTANDSWMAGSDDVVYNIGVPSSNGYLSDIQLQAGSNWDTNEYGRVMVCVSSTGVIVAQSDEVAGTGITEWITFPIGPSSVTANEHYKVVVWGGTINGGIGVHNIGDGNTHTWWKGDLKPCDYSASGNGNFVTHWNPFTSTQFDSQTAGYGVRIYANYTNLPNGRKDGTYTFGTSGSGDSGWISDVSDGVVYSLVTPDYDGVISNIKVRLNSSWSQTESGMAMITISSTGVIVAQSQPFVGDGTTHWENLYIGPSSVTAGTIYKLAFWGDAGTKIISQFYVDGDSISTWYKSADYSNSGNGDFVTHWNPFITNEFSDDDAGAGYHLRAYLTYDADVPPCVVSSNGCFISTQTTATISSQVWAGSGTATILWDTTDKGETKGDWTYSSKQSGIKYSGVTNAWKYQITNLDVDTTYYTRTYISSNWYAGICDYSNLTEFHTSSSSAPIYNNFNTPIGNSTSWIWNSGQFNVDSGMRCDNPYMTFDANTSSVVGTTQTNTTTRMPYSRMTFYAKNRHWVIYGYSSSVADSRGLRTSHVLTTSTDGISWAEPSHMCSGAGYAGADFSMCLDSNQDLHYLYTYRVTYGGPDAPQYRKGTLTDDGYINWVSPIQLIDCGGYSCGSNQEPVICVDSDDYPVISTFYRVYGDFRALVWISTTKDGTFTNSTADGGSPYSMRVDTDAYLMGDVVQLTNNKLYCVYGHSIRYTQSGRYKSGSIWGKLWDGSSWGSEELICNSGLSTHNNGKYTAVSIGDDIHVAWQYATSANHFEDGKVVHSFRDYDTGVWTSSNIQLGVIKDSPNLSKVDNDLVCFFASGTTTLGTVYYKKYDYESNTWDDEPTVFFTHAALLRNAGPHYFAVHNSAYSYSGGKLGFVHRVSHNDNDSKPYDVIYNWLDVNNPEIRWTWSSISSSSDLFYPSGIQTSWRWVSGNTGIS